MSRDAATGLLFIAMGASAATVAVTYPLGLGARLGAGVVPLSVALALVGIGGLLVARALRAGGRGLSGAPPRPLVAVLGSLIAFALVLPRFGFIAAGAVLVLLGGSAIPGRRPASLLLLAIGAAVAAWILFVRLLGVQAPAF